MHGRGNGVEVLIILAFVRLNVAGLEHDNVGLYPMEKSRLGACRVRWLQQTINTKTVEHLINNIALR